MRAAGVVVLVLILGSPATAGTARTPVPVDVSVVTPCKIAPPVSISLDASGKLVIVHGTRAEAGCEATALITVAVDTSKEGRGYVVLVSF